MRFVTQCYNLSWIFQFNRGMMTLVHCIKNDFTTSSVRSLQDSLFLDKCPFVTKFDDNWPQYCRVSVPRCGFRAEYMCERTTLITCQMDSTYLFVRQGGWMDNTYLRTHQGVYVGQQKALLQCCVEKTFSFTHTCYQIYLYIHTPITIPNKCTSS